MIFSRKRRKLIKQLREKVEYNLEHINEHSILRNILYDSQVPNPETAAKLLGLIPVSDEVSGKEREESTIRVSRFLPIFGLIDVHAQLVTRVVIASYIGNLKDEDQEKLTKKDLDTMEQTFLSVSRASILSALTILEETGIIHRGYMPHE